MAAARKLQSEIERCLKRVQEGIDEFDSIWEKVHDTDNSNQKEKFEADLKKEIKKLQRLRDQIKTWIGSADVKDKTQLVEARKSIEREMERFKLCEKEAKMKAFSKAALGQADKLDPREQAKVETREWINNAVDTLNEQIEKYEYEIEDLGAAGGKKKSKPPPRIEFLQSVIAVHKKHVAKLEAALRCLDNDALEAEDLDPIRDGLEYYLNQEDSEHYDNVDDLYADVADTLEAVESVSGPGTLVSHGSKGGSMGGKEGREGGRGSSSKGGEDEGKERERERERAAAAAAKAQLIAQGAITAKSLDEDDQRVRPAVRPPSVAPPLVAGSGSTPMPSPGVPPSPAGKGLAALQLPPAARSLSDSSSQQQQLGPGQQQDGTPAGQGITSPQQHLPPSPHASVLSPSSEPAGAGGVVSPLAAAAAAAAGPGALRPGGPLSPPAAAAAEVAAAAAASTGAGGAGAGPASGQGAPSGGRLGAWMAGAPAAPAPAPAVDTPQGANSTATAAAAVGAAAGPPAPAAATAVAGAGANAPPAAAAAGPALAPQQTSAAVAPGQAAPADGSDAAVPSPADAGAAGPAPAGLSAAEGSDPATTAPAGTAAAGPVTGAVDAIVDSLAGLSMDSSASGAAAFEVLSRLAAQDLGLGQLPAVPVGISSGGLSVGVGASSALGVLEAAFRLSLPQPVDSDWARSRPRHPVATPPTFPRAAPDIMSAPGLFRRMDPEALFFAFYYQPDTYQQYLAAQELKRQSWRYHKHHNAWFQRYAEPSVTNDEYEQGTYVYFDYNIVHDDLQTGWCYRRKENFTFRYDALEDELPVAPA